MNESEMQAGLAATPGYRYADRVGNRLYLAGQVPLDAEGVRCGPGNVAAQARQCLANLGVVLAVHGFNPSDIRRLTISVAGEHADLLEAWAAVVDHIGGEVPPATLVGVHVLGYIGQLVEVDADIERFP